MVTGAVPDEYPVYFIIVSGLVVTGAVPDEYPVCFIIVSDLEVTGAVGRLGNKSQLSTDKRNDVKWNIFLQFSCGLRCWGIAVRH